MRKFVLLFCMVLLSSMTFSLMSCEGCTREESAAEKVEEGLEEAGDAVEEGVEEVEDAVDDN